MDECKDGLDECGKTHGKCKNLRGTYECICPAGFKQSRNKKKCLGNNFFLSKFVYKYFKNEKVMCFIQMQISSDCSDFLLRNW